MKSIHVLSTPFKFLEPHLKLIKLSKMGPNTKMTMTLHLFLTKSRGKKIRANKLLY